MRINRAAWLAIPVLAVFTAMPALAQAPDANTAEQSEHSVARVSFIHGDVTMQRGDSGDFSSVTLNMPLMTGDKVATGNDSRTELQLDYANILRLDRDSEATLATMEKGRIQVQVGQGLAAYSVLKGSEADVEIDTPNVALHPVRPGSYRVEVNPDGDTLVTVNEGEAQVSTSEGSTTVRKGQLITIRGTGSEAQFKVTDASSRDDWDNWNRDRDNVIYNANAYQRTNRYYTGAGDLDSYGTWTEVPDYGSVWVPRVDYGWAPYRAGRWIWEPYWGWTWVSYEPWGWAPYHYGRWFLWGGSWAWWPGPIYPAYRPIWAPAYVSFFGFGGGVGFGVGFGFGSIGWFPIGPCDFFHPWWGGFRDRFAVVDFDRVGGFREGIAPLHAGDRFSNAREVLTNNRLREGVSGVPARSFGRGAIAARGVSAADIRGGRMMTGNLPVVPSRESVRASDRPVNPAMSARMNTQHSFFTKTTPAARPEAFTAQAAHVNDAIQRNGQFRAINSSATPRFTNENIGARSNSTPAAQGQVRSFEGQRAQSPAAPNQNSGGFQRFGNSGAATSPNSATRQAPVQPNAPFSRGNQGASEGWQRFSGPGAAAPSIPRSGGNRPTLDMNKPIVNERAYRGSSSDSYGGANRSSSAPAYRPAPSYSQPSSRGSYSAPSYQPRSYSAPAYRSYPSNQPSYRSAPAPRSYSGGSGGYSGGGSRGGGGGGARGGGSGGGSRGGGGGRGR